MAISLLTNVPSIDAQRNLNNTQVSLNKNISHLSSGLRITSASDDAAGLALSTHLLSQARGYTVAGRNANDGISVIQVAEGAIGEQSNILLRLRDLALQSANGVYSSNDRSYLDTERSSLESEIDRIANVTNFNGTSLLNAAATVDLQVGISNSANDKITVNFVDTKVGTLGLAAKIDTQKNAQTYIGEVDTAIEEVARVLRPAGGMLLVGSPIDAIANPGAWDRWLKNSPVTTVPTRSADGFWLQFQRGKFPGAGEWSHQYGSADNTACSQDELVQGDLQVAWWGEAPGAIKGTYYSSPVIAVIGGQRLLVSGGADGGLHAFKVRTGERAWSYRFGAGVINGSPIVDGNKVYCHHGEENVEGGAIGRVICVDASQIDAKGQPKLLWEFRRSNRFGLASGALHNGKLYIPDDSGELFCFDAKNGKVLWKYRYASEVRGAPLVADGKIYIFDVKGRLLIIPIPGDGDEPDEGKVFEYKFRDPKGLLNETNGTPIAVNGRVYFTTRTDLFCLGLPEGKVECGKYTPLPAEKAFDADGKPAALRIMPADAAGTPGGKLSFTVVPVDANGRDLKADGKAELTLPLPAKTPTGAQPPALNGKVEGDAVVLAPQPSQQGYVEAKWGDLTVKARVRVAAPLTYKQDFEKVPPGAVPGGWVNAQAKFVVKKLADGTTVLGKVNTNSQPPFARANAYITGPDAANYTIACDVFGTRVRDRMPDIGLVNSRYTLILDGKLYHLNMRVLDPINRTGEWNAYYLTATSDLGLDCSGDSGGPLVTGSRSSAASRSTRV